MKKLLIYYLITCILPIMSFAQWSNNPNQNAIIADTIGDQVISHVVRNSIGETYISWFSDLGDLNFDVYLQKLNTNGSKAWDNEGLLISNHITNTWVTDYDMILDNDENIIIVTQDYRTGNSNVFAYKISPTGEFLWGNDGVQLSNTTGFDPAPKVVVANNNDALFMWADEPVDTTQYSNIYITRVAPDGSMIWDATYYDTLDMMLPQMIKADTEGYYFSWVTKSKAPDTIPGQANWMHVFAQRISENGFPLWGNGIQVDSGNMMAFLSLYTTPYLTSDGNEGAYVMWQSFYPLDMGGMPTTYINRIYPDGTIWKPNGYSVSTLSENYHAEAQMEYLENINKLVVCWLEYHYDGINLIDCWGVRGQIFDTSGNYLWPDTGKVFRPLNCTMDTSYSSIKVSESTNNNIFLSYSKNYFSIESADTNFVTHINAMSFDANGEIIWEPPTTQISTTSSNKYQVALSNLTDDQWVLAWNDNISNPDQLFDYGIYAQNISVVGILGPATIHQNESNNIITKIWPNPAVSNLNITYALDKPSTIEIEVFNVSGKVIISIAENEKLPGTHTKQIDISHLKPGMYIVKLQARSTTTYSKIIKQ